MHKIYLLLRNNRQTGPYSLDELVQMGLKPTDLIWVEGRSNGWAYPSEIEALKPYSAAPADVNEQKPALPSGEPLSHKKYIPAAHSSETAKPSKKIFVSLPSGAQAAPVQKEDSSKKDLLEQKAEELRKRALAAPPEEKQAVAEPVVETRYSRPIDEVEESYTSWLFEAKTKRKQFTARQASEAAVVVLILAISFVLVRNLVGSSGSSESEPTTQAQSIQRNAAAAPITEESAPAAPEELTVSAENTTSAEITPSPATAALPKESGSDPAGSTVKKEIPSERRQPTQTQHLPQSQDVATTETAAVDTKEVSEPIVPDVAEQTEATPQKKKKLGEKIDQFFDRFKTKKEEGVASEQATSAERKASRREAETTAPPANLSDYVDVTANEKDKNWMMGIQGLKLTVKNRSTETVSSALVEVLYLNEDDELLDKKVVAVSNVPPHRSVTVSAPDHRLANRASYRLLSAQ